jgi:hypothetical protein
VIPTAVHASLLRIKTAASSTFERRLAARDFGRPHQWVIGDAEVSWEGSLRRVAHVAAGDERRDVCDARGGTAREVRSGAVLCGGAGGDEAGGEGLVCRERATVFDGLVDDFGAGLGGKGDEEADAGWVEMGGCGLCFESVGKT